MPGLDNSPLALPAKGETSTPTRTVINLPDESGSSLTLKEASEIFEQSVPSLRRKAKRGELEGAHTAPGPQGEEWRIPVATLERHFRRRETKGGGEELEIVLETKSAEVERLADALRALEGGLAMASRQLEAATEDRQKAAEQAAQAREDLTKAREDLAREQVLREVAEQKAAELEAKLEAAGKRRRLFGRK